MLALRAHSGAVSQKIKNSHTTAHTFFPNYCFCEISKFPSSHVSLAKFPRRRTAGPRRAAGAVWPRRPVPSGAEGSGTPGQRRRRARGGGGGLCPWTRWPELSPAASGEEKTKYTEGRDGAQAHAVGSCLVVVVVVVVIVFACLCFLSGTPELATVSNFRLLIPTQPRNEQQKNNTCLPKKAPRRWGVGGEERRPRRDELSAQLSANNNTPPLRYGAALPACRRRTDQHTDRPPSPPH